MDATGYQIATDAGAQIKGYASAASVEANQPITFFVSVVPAQRFTIDVYRLGWYGGAGGRLVQAGEWLRGEPQGACPVEASTGLRACDWSPALTFTIPARWVSGLYVAILTNARHFQNGIPFVVRADASTSALLYVEPVTTYQAYNNWPFNGTGRSLYPNRRAVKVSFDRPYAGSGVGNLFAYDQPFAAWLERAGYEVTYATSIDLARQGAALLERHRAMVVAGHDEYWTAGMRAAAQSAVQHGVSLAFFSANNIYVQVRLEAASDGRQDRVLVCYRDATLDPEPDATLKTVRWRDAPLDQPEQTLLGAQFTNSVSGYADWVVTAADNWVYAGTGLEDGQVISGLVSGEADRPFALPSSYGAPHVTLLSRSPFTAPSGAGDVSSAVIYRSASGAWVFDAGTFGWPGKVDPLGFPDPRVERMTMNLLDRMSGPSLRERRFFDSLG